eukprot:4798616-Prymnesium_polylepis.1
MSRTYVIRAVHPPAARHHGARCANVHERPFRGVTSDCGLEGEDQGQTEETVWEKPVRRCLRQRGLCVCGALIRWGWSGAR